MLKEQRNKVATFTGKYGFLEWLNAKRIMQHECAKKELERQ